MRILLKIAKSKVGRLLVGWLFAHMNAFLPLNRLHETDTLIAFYHPQPRYPVHILLVPKKAVGSLVDLNESDQGFLLDVVQTTQTLVEKLSLSEKGYRLILNGGRYQEVPQVHFHLVSGEGTLLGKHQDEISSQPGKWELDDYHTSPCR